MGVKRVTGGSAVALTFDDGPHPVYTPKILSVLRANGVRAVFCLVGTEVRKYPHLVARIAREGHTLCNHSWHHEIELGSWPAAKIRDNLLRTNLEIIRAVPGAQVKYFRQPGGKWTPVGVRTARELGMASLGWTVDPRDWEKPPANVISSRVLHQAHPGAVVLMHDAGGDRTGTISACRTLIPALKHRYRLAPLR
jgi:peptidoglycan/xylan/chitin deacetylase (PgdA/CDA1 family)